MEEQYEFDYIDQMCDFSQFEVKIRFDSIYDNGFKFVFNEKSTDHQEPMGNMLNFKI